MTGQETPPARAAHGVVSVGTKMYIFGGLGEEEALNDLWELDTDALKWTKMDIDGPLIPPRLDFAMTLIDIPWPETEDELAERLQNLQVEEGQVLPQQSKKFILVHGGMNTFGDIFDDLYLMRISQ